MSAGSVSLQSAVRTCDVNVEWASRIQSDRFLNPTNMLCPIWNGVDTAGREVCVDSFKTKRAGCSSALDRVAVENNLRPQYSEYVNLQALGIEGGAANVDNVPISGGNLNRQNAGADVRMREGVVDPRNPNGTGSFGNQFSETRMACGKYPMERALANESQNGRMQQAQSKHSKKGSWWPFA